MKKRDTIYVSPKGLAIHEFHDFFRTIRKHESFKDSLVLEKLYAQRATSMKTFAGLASASFVIFFATPNGINELSFSVQGIGIVIPKLSLVFISSLLWCFGVLHFQNYLILTQYLIVVKRTLFRHTEWSLLDRLFDGDSAWGDPVLPTSRFIKSGRFHSILLGASLFIALLPIAVLGLSVAWHNVSYAIYLLIAGELTLLSATTAISVLALFAHPILYSIAIEIPLPTQLNREYVRWNFLARIWRPRYRFHPNVNTWISREP